MKLVCYMHTEWPFPVVYSSKGVPDRIWPQMQLQSVLIFFYLCFLQLNKDNSSAVKFKNAISAIWSQIMLFLKGKPQSLTSFPFCHLLLYNWEIYAKDHLTWLTYLWPSTNPFLHTLVCGLFKIPGFSGRRYFIHLVPPPVFWNTSPPPKL